MSDDKQTDRELLEMAAKACGKYAPKEDCPNGWHGIDPDGYGVFTMGGEGRFPDYAWNPKNDDGDGASMEAALGIRVTWHSDGVVCGLRWAGSTELFDDHGGDKQAARRMASLRVAAEIGRAMP